MQSPLDSSSVSIQSAGSIVDDAWEELRRSPYVQQKLGVTPTRLPNVSFSEAERHTELGRSLLQRLDALDMAVLPHDLALALRLVRFRALAWSREAEWYWIVADPIGIGLFGLFLPTAYCGGWLLGMVHGLLAAVSFAVRGDCDQYLALVADYVRLVGQFAERTTEQARRGVLMPAPQVKQAQEILSVFKSQAFNNLRVPPQRLASVAYAPEFSRELDRYIGDKVVPAFDHALDCLNTDYMANAPAEVGIGQYPKGAEIYAELVKLHTTLDLSPEEVSIRGRERMEQIHESMAAIRAEVGFRGGAGGFLEHLRRDARWRANTTEGIASVFQRYMDRLKPCFSEYFPEPPQAGYGVAPLPEALESSMTYGYYDPSRPDRSQGLYRFNSKNLKEQTLIHLGALIYHELMPGHHLQFALQQENSALHPFQRYSSVNACNEAWAEYAASFAGEIGLYQSPEERYGRLIMDAFLTSRLVVDTGMNVFGWSLERAREYMRDNSGMAEAEIASETLRYSSDIPAQALAYKLGDTQIYQLRERMQSVLGARFSLKKFHTAVVCAGSLPLPDLAWHLEHEFNRTRVP